MDFILPLVFLGQVATFILSQRQNSLKYEDSGDILFPILPSHISSVLQLLFATFEQTRHEKSIYN